MSELSAEDAKLVALARSARARSGMPTGAALRDETGRTYVGVDVVLPTLALTAIQLCVAQAVAGGAKGAEAAVLVTGTPDAEPALDALADLGGAGVSVWITDPRGAPVRRVTT